VEKCTAGQATDDITAHALSMLDASHAGYVILTPSPLLQWLHENVGMLRCT